MATEKHKILATIIKDCHSSLRKLSKQYGQDKAWKEHINNKIYLKEYSQAMHQLAEIWEENCANENTQAFSRIKWTISYCLDYFDNDICLKKRERELRQLSAWCPHLTKENCSFLHNIQPQQISLLDVGSCYNPFKNVQRFKVTALDLSPATPEVLPADFLNVNIVEMENVFLIEKNIVRQIKSNHFHCIIFSLLLEYMPCSQQRILCCQKAYDALQSEGILIIITPDSEHVGKNAALMKQWQLTLAQIGFMRILFHKLPCITCLVYRKSIHRELPLKWAQQQPSKASLQMEIKIPQDH